jgi:hypothetical protein
MPADLERVAVERLRPAHQALGRGRRRGGQEERHEHSQGLTPAQDG